MSESLFDSLPDFIKTAHWTRPGHKEWKYCAYCRRCQDEDFRLKLCEGCVQKKGQQIYYCERKCQKLDWSNHQDGCLLGKADPSRTSERSLKLLSRWMSINSLTLRWCAEQAYHYTPRADPSTTLISFWIDGETKRLSRITIRMRDAGEARLFKPMPYLYTIHLEHPKSPGSSRDASYYKFDGITCARANEKIVGHPQFPWIAATVFGTLKQTSPSATVAEARLHLLCSVVTHHTFNGSLILPQSFNAHPIACALKIPSTQMLLWNYKLKSIDLWEPFSNQEQMVSSMFNLNYQLALSRTNLDSELRSDSATTAIVEHSVCQGGCQGHAR